jgi:hypothetical protein
LPFWPAGGLVIATQPLLIFALLNILRYELWFSNWIIIIGIPFMTVFAHSNLFLLTLIAPLFLFYTIKYKSFNSYFVFAIILFIICTVFAEHRLFEFFFIDKIETHRDFINHQSNLNINGIIGISFKHFLFGQYHFLAGQFPFIIAIILISFIFSANLRFKRNLFLLLTFTFILSVLYVLPNHELIGKMNFFRSPISTRFYSLQPLLWLIIGAYVFRECLLLGKFKKQLAIISFCFVCIGNITGLINCDYYGSYNAENSFRWLFFKDGFSNGYKTFEEYFKIPLFNKIRDRLPTGNYYIACLGFEPEIAQYNNYNTIEGYFYLIPKENAFRLVEINKPEFQKTGEIMSIENRQFIYSEDLLKKRKVIEDLRLNTEILLRHNCKFVFSTRRIVHEKYDFHFIESHLKDSLYVYRILSMKIK